MQSENLNETFLKKARKAKERFQRQKDKKIQYIPTKSQKQESQKRYTTKQKRKSLARSQSAQDSLQTINKTVLPYLIFKKNESYFSLSVRSITRLFLMPLWVIARIHKVRSAD